MSKLEQLRGILAERPGAQTWKKTIQALDSWPEDGLEDLLGVAIPYTRGVMLTWPGRIRATLPAHWAQGCMLNDPKHRALANLAFLNVNKAPDSDKKPRQRCSYYIYDAVDVEMIEQGVYGGERTQTYSSSPDYPGWMAHYAKQGFANGTNRRCASLSLTGDEYEALSPDTCYVVLNGVHIATIELMPDLILRKDGQSLQIRFPRKHTSSWSVNSKLDLPWSSTVFSATLTHSSGEEAVVALNQIIRHPLYAPFRVRRYFDEEGIELITEPVLKDIFRFEPDLNPLEGKTVTNYSFSM